MAINSVKIIDFIYLACLLLKYLIIYVFNLSLSNSSRQASLEAPAMQETWVPSLGQQGKSPGEGNDNPLQ